MDLLKGEGEEGERGEKGEGGERVKGEVVKG